MNDALEIVYAAIEEMNEQLEEDQRIQKAPDSTLFGDSDGIDSLSLVNLVVAIEREIFDRTGNSVILVDEDALAEDAHPFRSIETLAAHVQRLMSN